MTTIKPAAAGRSRTEVPQPRRLRRQGLSHRPDEVQPAEAEPAPASREINLAGIRPLYETTVKLGDGKDYRDRTRKLALPLKDEGAYLVVCRGDDLHASGLVLITPLAVEVQEDAVSGRVRTTVKDRRRPPGPQRPRQGDRQPQRRFRLRSDRLARHVRGRRHFGPFDGDRPGGTVAVCLLPRVGRSVADDGFPLPEPLSKCRPAAPVAASPASCQPPPPPGKMEMEKDGRLLDQLQNTNRTMQGQQLENLNRMYRSNQKGVEAKSAF